MSERAVKRWSAKRKQEVVLRLRRGSESLNALSRETGQPASVLSGWRDEFLEGGVATLKRCTTDDPKVAALEQQLGRTKRLVEELMMDKELLEMCIAGIEWLNHCRQFRPGNNPVHLIEKLFPAGRLVILLETFFGKRLLAHSAAPS